MSRRRRGKKKARRAAAGCVAVAAGWAALGHLAVLAALLALILVAGPAAVLLAPRRWRKRYRHWEHRPFFWAPYGREHARSAHISERLRRAVYAADRHQCVISNEDCSGPVQVDHICPWSQGGRTSLFNTMSLCWFHNVPVKSNYWPGAFYRGENRVLAAAVLAAEQRARWNPARWVRAALALAA